jgi:hypothetical protein
MILAAFDLLPDLAAHSGVLVLFGNLPSALGLNVRGQGSRQKCAPRPVRVLIPGKQKLVGFQAFFRSGQEAI